MCDSFTFVELCKEKQMYSAVWLKPQNFSFFTNMYTSESKLICTLLFKPNPIWADWIASSWFCRDSSLTKFLLFILSFESVVLPSQDWGLWFLYILISSTKGSCMFSCCSWRFVYSLLRLQTAIWTVQWWNVISSCRWKEHSSIDGY